MYVKKKLGQVIVAENVKDRCICGHPVGEEGYSQKVVCFTCNDEGTSIDLSK